MFEDARGLPSGSQLDADICVVGAGVAGITIALELAGRSNRVIVLESGGADYESATQALHRGINAGLRYEPLNLCRIRGFGGSTIRGWGGWCKPLSSIDFERREWVALSGWPIGREDLDSYYERAYLSLNLWPATSRLRSASAEEHTLLPLAGASCHNELCDLSAPDHMRRSGEAGLRGAENVTVFLHASVTEIETDRDARAVVGVRATTLAGNVFRVVAPYYVLAAGGIENARLLLVSNRHMAQGLGNESDFVGRCFMEHPRFGWGEFHGDHLGRRLGYYDPGTIVRQREQSPSPSETILTGAALVLPPETQRREQILNARSWIVPIPEGGETESGQELRELIFWFKKRRIPSDMFDRLQIIARDFPGLARTITAYYRGRAGRAERWGLVTVMEQAPNPLSRVTLDASRDRLGLPRARLDWRMSGLERKTLEKNREHIVASLARLGLDCSTYSARGNRWEEKLEHSPRWVWHHMGTTRMAANSKQGVVDSSCCVHGVANLYVAGSSVFPTVGNDMPTLTIIALAHRLADHLKSRLGSRVADFSKPSQASSVVAGR
jgi:choline dehydrogenase-like flavoprotein